MILIIIMTGIKIYIKIKWIKYLKDSKLQLFVSALTQGYTG